MCAHATGGLTLQGAGEAEVLADDDEMLRQRVVVLLRARGGSGDSGICSSSVCAF